MKNIVRICIFFILFGSISPCSAVELLPCGSFKNVSGEVFVIRQDNKITAESGAKIYPRDQIQSGKDGSAGLILQDDTIICLGPDSIMDMTQFIFNPSVYEYSLVTSMLRGTFLFLSGVIAKISPDNVKINTPDGTIAIRGTRFLVEVTP